MFGIIFGSGISGALMSKFGHYKTYPIIGSALLTLGVGLLSLIAPDSGQGQFIPFLLILGLGIGLIISISTVAAQNSVEMIDMGATTALINFCRTIGGVFGVTYFSLLFSHFLTQGLDAAVAAREIPNIAQLYSDGITKTFLYCIPFSGVAFISSLFLKQIALRKTMGTAPPPE